MKKIENKIKVYLYYYSSYIVYVFIVYYLLVAYYLYYAYIISNSSLP